VLTSHSDLRVFRRRDGPKRPDSGFNLLDSATAFNPALAVGELLVYHPLHSKSLSAGEDVSSVQHQTPQKHQEFRVFFVFLPRRPAASSLDQGEAGDDRLKVIEHMFVVDLERNASVRIKDPPT
jgi:hypothetical protein